MRERLLLLGGQTIALGLMMAFLVVPASALFLDEYGADALPYAYLAVAVTGVATSVGLSRAQRRLSLASLALAVFWIYLLVVGTAWVVVTVWDGVWVTFPLLVLFPLSIPIGFALVGAQAGRLLDVRQLKAGFPRVAAGFSVGFAVGGLGAAALVDPLGGPTQLLAVDLLMALAMVALVLLTGHRYPDELRAAPEPSRPEDRPTRREGRWRPLRNRLVAIILGYQLLSAAVTQLLDFMVWERAAARYPDPSDLAQFLGVYGAILNVVSVVFVVGLAGWILTRFGIGLGLAANPLGVLVLLVVTGVVGFAAGPVGFLFLALVCAQQVTDIALTDGTTRTSINATYQALLPEQRLQAQTLVEGAGVPVALGFVGVLLIVQDALGLDVRAVGVVTLLLTLVWVWTAVLAYREYGAGLRVVLSRRAWDPVALRMDDERSRSAVEQLLTSGDLRDAETALEALLDAGSPDVSSHVTALLAADDPARRLVGATVAGSAGWTGPLGSPDVVGAVHGLLTDEDPAVRLAAAVALVGLEDGHGEAARRAWLSAVAAEDPVLVRTALEAAARSPDLFFAPSLVRLAASPSAPAELLDALVAHADQLCPLVEPMLGDPTVPRRTRERLVHALGEAATPQARDLLVAHLGDGDPEVVEAAARALAAAGHREPAESTDLQQALTTEAGRVSRCLQVLDLLDDRPGSEPLVGALRDEVTGARRRAEVLLSLVHDPLAIRAGIEALGADSERERSAALEMLEVTVGRTASRVLLAIAGPTLDDRARQLLLAEHAAVASLPLAEWLRQLVRDDGGFWREPWLQACALYAVPDVLPAEAEELARGLLDHEDPVVTETARWVSGRASR